MDLNKILEYQEYNISLKKLDKEYERLDDKKKLDVVRGKYNDLQNTVNIGETEAQSLISGVDACYNEYRALMESFDKLNEKIEAAATDEEKVKFLPQVESIKSKLENVDRKISQKIKRSKDIVATCAKAQESKKAVKVSFDEIKKRLDDYKAEKSPARKAILDKMDALKTEIDKDFFDRYSKLRGEGIFPVLVPAAGDGNIYSCYCGMSLSQAKNGELTEKKICQCESCRRMIYLK